MRRLVFISLEFSAATFSGNGVYARSQVRSLCKQQCEVLIICGKPVDHAGPSQTEGAAHLIEVTVPVWGRLDRLCSWAELAEQSESDAVVEQVASFQPSAILGVDWSSLPVYKALSTALQAKGLHVPPYIYMNYRVYLRTCLSEDAEFMQGMESAAAATAAAVIALSRSDADFIKRHLLPPQKSAACVTVLLPALRSDMAALSLPYDMDVQHNKLDSTHTASAACIVLPRAHSNASTAAQDSSQPAATAAVARGANDDSSPSKATSDIAARAVDESPIRSIIKQTSLGARVSPSIGRRTTPFSISTPNDSDGVESSVDDQSTFVRALQDHHASADGLLHQEVSSQECMAPAHYAESSNDSCSRPYLTCCVRLSPEKQPHRFVELVEELAHQGMVQQLGIIPVMCASATTPYALALVARLQAAAPNCILHTQFLGPEELAKIYSKTRLNIHPCLYDAYGMTVVEAASQGAPSIVNAGGTVGATDLLKAPVEVFELNLALPVAQLASQIMYDSVGPSAQQLAHEITVKW
ncbi:MAG: hypothetical protein FRX49_01066 [Trebouxia sp. A1-2]|nr:MAG: hypothetical protein FRX49_01066 [Trebouxia sp. A1-2]